MVQEYKLFQDRVYVLFSIHLLELRKISAAGIPWTLPPEDVDQPYSWDPSKSLVLTGLNWEAVWGEEVFLKISMNLMPSTKLATEIRIMDAKEIWIRKTATVLVMSSFLLGPS